MAACSENLAKLCDINTATIKRVSGNLWSPKQNQHYQNSYVAQPFQRIKKIQGFPHRNRTHRGYRDPFSKHRDTFVITDANTYPCSIGCAHISSGLNTCIIPVVHIIITMYNVTLFHINLICI